MRIIKFYKTKAGKCPVEEFIDKLNPKAAQKVAWAIEIVEEMNILPANYFTKLIGSDDIYEIRVILGNNIYRIFCFFHQGNIVVLTHGIIKKTQKTPPKEIKKAEAYKHDYLRRHQ